MCLLLELGLAVLNQLLLNTPFYQTSLFKGYKAIFNRKYAKTSGKYKLLPSQDAALCG
jgi:hypothetical protein